MALAWSLSDNPLPLSILAGAGLEKILGVRGDLIIGQLMELFLYFFSSETIFKKFHAFQKADLAITH